MKKTIFVLLFLCIGLQGFLGYKVWRDTRWRPWS